VRPLVLKTVLTYLELDGLLRQGTPFYAGYRLRPVNGSLDEVVDRFDSARADFLRRVIAAGKTGRTWTSIDPEAAASALGEDRARILAALEYLEQQGLVELQAAEARQRYTLLSRPASSDAVLDQLTGRFQRREQAETARVGRVLELVAHDGCQVRALTAYFGETRPEPCGHCTHCLTGRAQELPEAEPQPAIDVEKTSLGTLIAAHPEALGEPRQLARFLCGISSPATTRAKLTREPLFGALADRRFLDVLGWSESLDSTQSR
jgi:ATP-dependent DNA helicase RecQ